MRIAILVALAGVLAACNPPEHLPLDCIGEDADNCSYPPEYWPSEYVEVGEPIALDTLGGPLNNIVVPNTAPGTWGLFFLAKVPYDPDGNVNVEFVRTSIRPDVVRAFEGRIFIAGLTFDDNGAELVAVAEVQPEGTLRSFGEVEAPSLGGGLPRMTVGKFRGGEQVEVFLTDGSSACWFKDSVAPECVGALATTLGLQADVVHVGTLFSGPRTGNTEDPGAPPHDLLVVTRSRVRAFNAVDSRIEATASLDGAVAASDFGFDREYEYGDVLVAEGNRLYAVDLCPLNACPGTDETYTIEPVPGLMEVVHVPKTDFLEQKIVARSGREIVFLPHISEDASFPERERCVLDFDPVAMVPVTFVGDQQLWVFDGTGERCCIGIADRGFSNCEDFPHDYCFRNTGEPECYAE
jgi:hypothetical protein